MTAGLALMVFSTTPVHSFEYGKASYYASNLVGRKTASGQRYSHARLTAAHKTLRFGTKVRVTKGSKSVIVTINDRGPFVRGRIIDLSKSAASRIGLVSAGVANVKVEIMK